MSRLDYFTVAIVAICLAAIIFLLYRTTDLFKSEVPVDPPTQEEPAEEIIDPADYDPDLAGSQDTDSTAMADAAAEPQETANPAEDEKEEEEPTEEPEAEAFSELYNAGGGVGDFLVLAGSFEYRHNADNQAQSIEKIGLPGRRSSIVQQGEICYGTRRSFRQHVGCPSSGESPEWPECRSLRAR
jgi:hypothetical protein